MNWELGARSWELEVRSSYRNSQQPAASSEQRARHEPTEPPSYRTTELPSDYPSYRKRHTNERYRRLHPHQPRPLRRRAEGVPRHSEHQRPAAARRPTSGAAPNGRPTRCAASASRTSGSIETPGNPVVYGDWLGAEGAPTILFYGHYDVQPVDPLDLWESPPFEATIRDGEIYARGAADDKGQVFMHFKAIEAHLKKNGRLPVNIKVIIEGEEEVGIRQPRQLRRRTTSDALGADVVVISDSPMFDRGIPSICYGLRGPRLLPDRPARHEERPALRVVRRRGRQPGDGAGADPRADEGQAAAASRFPASTTTSAPLRDEERAELARSCRSTRRATARISARRSCSARPATRRSSGSGRRPTFEVNGLLAGLHGRGRQDGDSGRGDGEGQHAPRARSGSGQDRASCSRTTSQKIAPKTVELKVTRMHGGKPWMTEFDNPFVQAAGRAIEQGFGKAPVFNREGGSIPVVATFQESSGCRRCCSASACPTRTRTRRTRSSTSATSTAASSRRRSSTTRLRERAVVGRWQLQSSSA